MSRGRCYIRAESEEWEFIRSLQTPAPFDAAVIRAADELHDDSCITDATWNALAERYDEKQMVEVPMLVGHYHMVSFTLNSLGVPINCAVKSAHCMIGGQRHLVVFLIAPLPQLG